MARHAAELAPVDFKNVFEKVPSPVEKQNVSNCVFLSPWESFLSPSQVVRADLDKKLNLQGGTGKPGSIPLSIPWSSVESFEAA